MARPSSRTCGASTRETRNVEKDSHYKLFQARICIALCFFLSHHRREHHGLSKPSASLPWGLDDVGAICFFRAVIRFLVALMGAQRELSKIRHADFGMHDDLDAENVYLGY